MPYQSGNRHGMVKVKRLRTADCVVGGFRYASEGKVMGSLLLGLYDEDGLAASLRVQLEFQSGREARADEETGKAGQAARLHRQCSGRAESLGHRTIG